MHNAYCSFSVIIQNAIGCFLKWMNYLYIMGITEMFSHCSIACMVTQSGYSIGYINFLFTLIFKSEKLFKELLNQN